LLLMKPSLPEESYVSKSNETHPNQIHPDQCVKHSIGQLLQAIGYVSIR
jgi:hypothetical protein